ncbi:MAG: hypothetical protein CL462_01585 [Acidimicrobiaceae bacterium]|nr:hypothetical protein [Acidobacteriota bacterium]MBJ81575.1 hypothetical protein [Acidimicrobiaceae bacterium]|tara:strand:- start:227 stop:760 length:534 start_codon:yes stop_codon:yes gene_type:complete
MIPAMKESVAAWLTESQAQELAVYLLGNVPGLPPIAQSFHILGIAVVMSSTVMINLRLLGLAVPSQNVSEMIGRLMPWTWWALLVNATTGLLFVVARPNRYFYNPVFSWKFLCLVPAVLLALVIYRMSKREPGYWEQSTRRLVSARVIASISLVLWVGVVLAGRWIAYSDYLYFLYE